MQNKVMKLEIGATITWKVEEYSDCFVAHCDTLLLSTFAKTKEELKKEISTMLGDLFEELIMSGDLEKYLKKVGWKKTTLPKITKKELKNVDRFDVPFELCFVDKGGQHVVA